MQKTCIMKDKKTVRDTALKAMRSFIRGETIADCSAEKQDFQAILDFANRHKVLPTVVESLHNLYAITQWTECSQYKRAARMQVIQQARRGLEFLEVYRTLD